MVDIRTQIWKPDTCECEVLMQYDLDEPPDTRTHTVTGIIRACPAHIAHSVGQLHTVLFDENRRKNRFHGRAVEVLPAVFPIDAQGNVDFSRITWYYDSNRVLQVTVSGITSQQRTTLQNAADQLFGVGKVVIS